MATLTATQVTAKTHVRLDLNWSDNLDVQYIKIIRLLPGQVYDPALNTGGTPIRLPTWGNTFTDANGTWTYLSNGRGTWYDTEAPMDVAVTWVAVASITATSARDTYTRSVSNNWGTADSGGTWVVTAAATQWQVTGTVGTVQPSATGSDRFGTLTLSGADRTVQADVRVPALPASGTLRMGVVGRYIDASNHYFAEITISTAGVVTLRVVRRVAAAETVIATKVLLTPYVGNAWWRIRFLVAGTRVAAKAWPVFDLVEPVAWTIDTTDATIATGTLVGAWARNETAVTTHVYSFDNFQAYANTRTTVTLSSGAVTMASSSQLWLKDPVRPYLDQPLNLCPTGPSGCTLPSGLFFHSMGTFTRSADQQIGQVANRTRPVALSRARKAPTAELRVVTRTLVDRDAAVALTAAGTPLMLQAPAIYGYPDRYLAVGDVPEDLITVDHRNPLRLFALPWAEVDAPTGGGLGVSKTRVDDLCNVYATWTALTGAGLTWTQIMQGAAG